MKKIKLLFYILIFATVSSCEGQNHKINGVSFVAQGKPVDESHTQPVANINANYAALMPFGFIRNLDNPKLQFNTERQWFGERSDGVKQYAKALREHGIKLMIKPQIWMRGRWIGEMDYENEEEWRI